MKPSLPVALLLLFALSLSLVACSREASRPAADETAELRVMLSYYETRLAELEASLLDAKAELYEKEVALSLAASAEPAPTQKKQEPKAQPVWFHTDGGGFAEITGASSIPSEVVIPSELSGLPVEKIGDRAFAGENLRSVVLPEGITWVGWFAFSGCTELREITLPASLQKIEYGAFENCPSGLVFVCPEDSYAALYARSYGFAVRTN